MGRPTLRAFGTGGSLCDEELGMVCKDTELLEDAEAEQGRIVLSGATLIWTIVGAGLGVFVFILCLYWALAARYCSSLCCMIVRLAPPSYSIGALCSLNQHLASAVRVWA